MTETPDAKTYQATPRGTLLEQIMDATQAKNEREWAAMREIETLRQRVAELEESEKSWIERGNYWTDEAAKINAELAALKIDNGLTIAYMSGFRDGKKDAQKDAQKRGDPVLYQCTKCGGANYACDCDSFRYCTKPLYEGCGDA